MSITVRDAPARYVGPAFQGWRAWRIMRHETLGGPSTVRLCACGTRGLPKVWEPLTAARAVCGKFATTHDAPWPDCQCGFYAYGRREDAWNHLETFVHNNGEALGWAFGRVSLWGRIVEHELGLRAEYAYPYELTVYGTAELANTVRRLYAIDVDVLPATDLPQPVEEQENRFKGLNSVYEIRGHGLCFLHFPRRNSA